MTIVRNGVEYKLTWEEEYDVYRKVKRGYLIEDIKAKAKEMEQDLTNADIEWIADYAERTIEHNDSYYESYWYSIEFAIEETTQN